MLAFNQIGNIVITMTKVKLLRMRAITLSSNRNVQDALVGYFLHLSHFPADYEGATKEAAYDLEWSDADEFKAAMERAGS